ncbi:hypothetical protein OM788_004291 [Streptomyces sp. KA12]|uniref:hypothetical protein n=1 Tax=Streptomyces sp. KA12 TaxID=2991730 RepID=UPI0023AF7D7F|nr:hypothetical protein [Streptomyces sp. KA12]MDF0374382.1 hypothetical protein [Streptomyces sp. KA12]
MKIRRRWPTVLGAALPLVFSVFVAAPPAQAAPARAGALVDVVCTGNETSTYTPPLTNTPQPTTVQSSENYSCTSLLTGVSSGTSTTTISGSYSCVISLQPFSATSTYHWNTGQTSTAEYDVTLVRAANNTTVVTAVGTVTAGLGQGAAFTNVIVKPALNLTACASGGLAQLTGPATLTLLL